MRVVVITPPEPAVLLEQAAAQLGLGDGDDRSRLEDLLAAVTAPLDGPSGWLNRSLGVQTLEARFDAFPCGGPLDLPYPPLIEVLSVKYLTAAGVEVTIAPAAYVSTPICATIEMLPGVAWPAAGRGREMVRVRYRAGYPVLPPAAQQAILLLVQAEFDGDPDGELQRRADKMLASLWLPR